MSDGITTTPQRLDWIEGLLAAAGIASARGADGDSLTARVDDVDVTIAVTSAGASVRHSFGIPGDAFGWAIPGVEPVATPSAAEVVARVVESRWGPVRGQVIGGNEGREIVIECPLVVDGLTRFAFESALAEIAKTRHVIDRLVADDRTQRDAVAGLARVTAPAAPQNLELTVRGPGAPPPVAAGLPPPPPMSPAPSPPTPPPMPPAAPAWTPTHRVPAGGLRAWTGPSPTSPAAPPMPAGLLVAVVEQWGDWARAVGVTGTWAWVDARMLESLRR